MIGMHAMSGEPLGGVAHLHQSIQDLFMTRKGTRVLREGYGSDMPDLVDRPISRAVVVDIAAAAAIALDEWEPRFRLTKVTMASGGANGTVIIDLHGDYLPDGREIKIEGVVVK